MNILEYPLDDIRVEVLDTIQKNDNRRVLRVLYDNRVSILKVISVSYTVGEANIP